MYLAASRTSSDLRPTLAQFSSLGAKLPVLKLAFLTLINWTDHC